MNRIEKMLMVAVLAGLSCSANAVTAENRYETITDRNIFRLNPTPPITAPPSKDESVLDRKVDLSGFSNVGGHKKAWFVVAPKPGSKEPPLYLSLSEGQRQDFLEVVSISEDEGEVKILNSGNAMVLSLKNNSLKPQAVAPAPPAPGAPPVAHTTPAPRPRPTPTSYGNRNSYSSNNSHSNGSSYNNGTYGRGGVTVSGGAPISATVNSQPAEKTSGLRTIPTRTLRVAPSVNQQSLSPAQQAANMLIQKKLAESQGRQLPPLPFPTPP